MFRVMVRDHVMVAHSLRGAVFGPAQQLHGATYVVEVTFAAQRLDPDGIVVDIGIATTTLHDVLAALTYRNLDDLPEFEGVNTTTEVLAKHVVDVLAERALSGALGASGLSLHSISAMLHETPVASAGYERLMAAEPSSP